MSLKTSFRPLLLQARVHLPRRRVALGLLLLLAIELLGRRTANDSFDLLALAALGVAAAMLHAAHTEQALPGMRRARVWLRLLARSLVRRVPEFGFDLRCDRPFPRGVPPLLRGLLLAACGLVLCEAVWIFGIAAPFRATMTSICYLAFLLLEAIWWLLCLVGGRAFIVFALSTLDDFRKAGGVPNIRPRRWKAAYGILLVVGAVWLPDAIAYAGVGCAVIALALGTFVRHSPSQRMLWRERGKSEIGSFDWRMFTTLLAALIFLPTIALLLPTYAIHAGADGATPISHVIGTAALWAISPGLLAVALFQTILVHRLRRNDPASPCPTTVHVSLPPDMQPPAGLAERFAARGWRTRFAPQDPERTDVRIRLAPPPMVRPADGVWRWPITVSLSALAAPELLDLLARRDVVQRRRLLLRGLARMMKQATRHRYEQGTGFWIAPHYWFVASLSRDTDERDERAHLSFAQTIPLAAREHFHHVMRDVDIDIIFVEDGVAWRAVRALMRLIFAHHDVHGDNLRLAEHHMSGVVGVRVIIHEHELGAPWENDTYPAPDSEDLGRARILHVFKDRGGDEVPDESPGEDEGRDAPAPVAPTPGKSKPHEPVPVGGHA